MQSSIRGGEGCKAAKLLGANTLNSKIKNFKNRRKKFFEEKKIKSRVVALCIKFNLRPFLGSPELLNIVYGKLYIWTEINVLKGLKMSFPDFAIKMGMFICNLELFCKEEEERKRVLEYFLFIIKIRWVIE